MDNKNLFVIILVVLGLFIFSTLGFAYEFNGTVYNLTGARLNNSVVNITFRDQQWNYIGSNSTTTNASGWFNITLPENQSWNYRPEITFSEGGSVQFVGQTLPYLNLLAFSMLENINFYLRPAGTMNITAFNGTSWAPQGFKYQIIDQSLGFPIAEEFSRTVTNVIVSLPRSRNYTIMILPNQSLPLFFNWNNFSSEASYNMSTISKYSNYNVTTRTLHKEFNVTMSLVRVTGYINNVTGPIGGWNSLVIVPYLLQPRNTIMLDDVNMPYNMSAFWGYLGQPNQAGDKYNLSDPGKGFYNITLPGPAEGASYVLMAVALNNSDYYGGFANVSNVEYAAAGYVKNISLYGLAGVRANVSLSSANTWEEVNVTLLRKPVTLLNQSNATLTNFGANVETSVNYTSYGGLFFTYITDIDQSGSSNFSLPLLNITGIEEMNIYTQELAPKRKTFTRNQVNSHLNVTLKTFAPAGIDTAISSGNLFIAMYFSNSTCDVPNPPSPCQIGSSENMATNEPMKAVFGGGKISFRMRTGNISVHYVNVDMLASGPPEALFDDSTTNSSSGDSFSAAMRFGSGGPNIYDYILVGFPYSDGTGGLNENSSVNVSIPYYYTDNWSLMWNITVNGTDASALAGNNSHYAGTQSAWQVLMNANNTCGTSQSAISVSAPCFINRTENIIWLRIPHFSGTGPKVVGSSVTATSSSSTSTSSSSSAMAEGRSSSSDDEEEEVVIEEEEVLAMAPSIEAITGFFVLEDDASWLSDGTVVRQGSEGDVFSLSFVNSELVEEEHSVTIKDIDATQGSVTLLVQSEIQEVVLFLGTGKEIDLDQDGENDLLVIFDNYENGIVNLQFSKLSNWVAREGLEGVPEATVKDGEEESGSYLWIVLLLVLFVIAIVAVFLVKNRGKSKRR